MVDVFCCFLVICIIVVIFYFGYVCQDCCLCFVCVVISVKVVVDMLIVVGVNCVFMVDLYVDQIQGFFDILVDNIYGFFVLVDDIEDQCFENLMIVFLDIGGVVCVCVVVKFLGVDFVIIDKCCFKVNQFEVMYIIGDVEGCICVLVDDMVDIVGIFGYVVKVLKEYGVVKVIVYCIYLVLFGCVIENIEKFVLDELVVINIILLFVVVQVCGCICQLDIVLVVVEVMCWISNEELISVMFC